MLKVGDSVEYVADGSKGTIVEIEGNLYHIVWDDHFSSWEQAEHLRKNEAFP